MKFEILTASVIETVPSASGIVKSGNHFFVVGDDSPFLFRFDEQLKEMDKIRIYSSEHVEGNRITKKHKPDFEAMEKINEQEIAIFGSGSKSPQRDYFVRLRVKEEMEVKTHSITPFYEHLKSLEEFKDSELNIEAAAEYKGTFFLFNRKRNLVISFSFEDFLAHVEEEAPVPGLKISEVKLPKIRNIEAGFSGATAFPHKPLLIFTASVEDTENAYDDGEILGSMIGMLDMETFALVGEPILVESPHEKDGPVKVESVAVEEELDDGSLNLLLTTDSDGGTSLFIRGRLSLE